MKKIDVRELYNVVFTNPGAPTLNFWSRISRCKIILELGGKLTDIRRKQQRLAGQVEELQMAMNELVDPSQLADIEGYEFNMESFKRESSALPEMPKFCAALPSYSLFNSAPYSPTTSRFVF